MPETTSIEITSPQLVNHAALATSILQEWEVLYGKIEKAAGVARDDVQPLLTETLRFMHLIGYHRQKLSPSHIVDMAWHEFILCTRAYHHFCKEQYGRYIHHTPGGDEAENQHNYRKTIKLYVLAFGQPAERFWGQMASEMGEDADCGSCLGTN